MNSEPVRKGLILDSIRLFIYLIASGYIFFVLATSRPHAGAWYEIFLLILLPGICFRVFLVIFQFVNKREVTRRWLAGIVTVIAGLFIAGQLIQLETDISKKHFIRLYQPLVNTLETGNIDPCLQPGERLIVPETALPKVKRGELFGRVQWTTDATVYFLDEGFVISVPVSSIDIDGGRLYYNSRGNKWEMFHNDLEIEVKKFMKLTENSVPCSVPES